MNRWNNKMRDREPKIVTYIATNFFMTIVWWFYWFVLSVQCNSIWFYVKKTGIKIRNESFCVDSLEKFLQSKASDINGFESWPTTKSDDETLDRDSRLPTSIPNQEKKIINNSRKLFKTKKQKINYPKTKQRKKCLPLVQLRCIYFHSI